MGITNHGKCEVCEKPFSEKHDGVEIEVPWEWWGGTVDGQWKYPNRKAILYYHRKCFMEHFGIKKLPEHSRFDNDSPIAEEE